MTKTVYKASQFIIAALFVGFGFQAEAQKLGHPGTVPGEVTSIELGTSEMAVTSAFGTYQEVTTAQIGRSMDFRRNKDLFTVVLKSNDEVIENIVFAVRDVASTDCGSVVFVATPTKRLAQEILLTVTDPSSGCQTVKTKAVLTRLDGTIEMEGTLASPF